jgi:hypothetical protein
MADRNPELRMRLAILTTPTTRARLEVAAAVIVADAVMLATMGRAVAGLAAALGVAYLFWLRPLAPEPWRIVPAYLIAIAAYIVHFAEEYWFGFYLALPPVFDAPAWSRSSFVAFNVAWLSIFSLSAVGLVRKWRPALLVALFLAIGGGLLNGVAHAALAIRAGGYFPGAYTAALVFRAGGNLAIRFVRRPATPMQDFNETGADTTAG